MKTILVIEDNENDALLMKRACKLAGINHLLKFVEDGKQAMAYLSGEGAFADRTQFPLPDLILLDLKMAYFSGLDVLLWIRNHAELHSLVVVILTSSSEERDVERAYRFHCNGYIVKPPTLDGLVNALRSATEYWLNHNYVPRRLGGAKMDTFTPTIVSVPSSPHFTVLAS